MDKGRKEETQQNFFPKKWLTGAIVIEWIRITFHNQWQSGKTTQKCKLYHANHNLLCEIKCILRLCAFYFRKCISYKSCLHVLADSQQLTHGCWENSWVLVIALWLIWCILQNCYNAFIIFHLGIIKRQIIWQTNFDEWFLQASISKILPKEKLPPDWERKQGFKCYRGNKNYIFSEHFVHLSISDVSRIANFRGNYFFSD